MTEKLGLTREFEGPLNRMDRYSGGGVDLTSNFPTTEELMRSLRNSMGETARRAVPVFVALGSVAATALGCAPQPSPAGAKELSQRACQEELELSGKICFIPHDKEKLAGTVLAPGKPLGTVGPDGEWGCVVEQEGNIFDFVMLPDPDRPDPNNRAIVKDDERLIQCRTFPPKEATGEPPKTVTPSFLPPVSPSPQPDLTAIQEKLDSTRKLLDCLDGNLPLENCASRVDYNSVKTRFDMVENLIGKENISLRSKSEIEGTLYTIRQMENEGRIRWYVYDTAERVDGEVTTGRSRLPRILGGTDFFAIVALAQDQSGREAEVYSVSFHELLHAVRAYERFRQGADPASDRLPVQEEYDAYYYELLVEMVARRNGIPSEGEETILQGFGIDLAKVVYDLDQSNIGPESEIFRFLSDWSFRYQALCLNEVLEKRLTIHPSDVNIKDKIEKNKSRIEEIEARWHDFPQKGSAELEIIETIERNGWCLSSFFNNLPEE